MRERDEAREQAEGERGERKKFEEWYQEEREKNEALLTHLNNS